MGCGASATGSTERRYQPLQPVDVDKSIARLLDQLHPPPDADGGGSRAPAVAAVLSALAGCITDEPPVRRELLRLASRLTDGDADAWADPSQQQHGKDEQPEAVANGAPPDRGHSGQFVVVSDGTDSSCATPKGPREGDADDAPEGVVTFVFTDITASTVLWEQVPDAMDMSLSLHNDVMRRVLRDCGGYEVKTIGDAFFLAFGDPQEAMQFCFTVQSRLNEQEWPEELKSLSYAAKVESQGDIVYNGLRVRMGCHVGEAIREVNPLTRRADYRGHAVNTAARVESQGVGGQVTFTAEVRESIEGCLPLLDDPVILPIGLRTLKGVARPVRLFAAVPAALRVRLAGADEDRDRLETSLVKQLVQQRQVEGLGERLGMSMRRSRSTLCVLRPHSAKDPALTPPQQALDAQCAVIRSAAFTLEATEGSLESISGDSILVAWNTVKACQAHAQQGLRFAAMLHSRRNPEPTPAWSGVRKKFWQALRFTALAGGLAASRLGGGSSALAGAAMGIARQSTQQLTSLAGRTAGSDRDELSTARAATSPTPLASPDMTPPISKVDSPEPSPQEQPLPRMPGSGLSGFASPLGAASPTSGSLTQHGGPDLLFGLAMGKVLHGTVGTSRQRSRVIIGHQERIAHALADHCPALGCLALFTRRSLEAPAEYAGVIEAHLRPVDVWSAGSQKALLVEQVDLSQLGRAEGHMGVWEFLSDAEAAGMGGGEATITSQRTQMMKSKSTVQLAAVGYADHFRGAMSGSQKDLASLRAMATDSHGGTVDEVLSRVCELIDAHTRSGAAGPARYALPCLSAFHGMEA